MCTQHKAIRAPIFKGNITLYDLSTSLPLDDTKIAKVNLTGSEILEALEYSVHRLVKILRYTIMRSRFIIIVIT